MAETYKVFQVIYRGKGEGLCAVAVSSSSPAAAKARLRGHRPAEIIDVEIIPGREPEWKQDRIEGTVDMRYPMKAAPQAGTREAEEIRASNRQMIFQKLGLSE